MAPSDYVYGVTLDGLSKNINTDDLRTFFAYATNNLIFGPFKLSTNDTISLDLGVLSKAEVDKILQAKSGLEASNVTMSQPTISHQPVPLLSPSNSMTGLNSNSLLTNYTLPASPPSAIDTSPIKPTRHFHPPPTSSDELPKNVYVLNLPLDMSQGEFEAVFSQFGKIEHACLLSMLDSLGRRRGFLLMASYEEACNLVNKTQGRTLKNCRLEVSWAQVQKGSHSEQQGAPRQAFSRFQPPPADSHRNQWQYNAPFRTPPAPLKTFSPVPPRAPVRPADRARSSESPPPNMTSTTVIAEGLCVKAFPTIDQVIRGFLPRGDVTGATFLSEASSHPMNDHTLTRTASVTFRTIREAANAVSWMHGRFYGGKQIKVRWEGEGFPRKVKRATAPVRLDLGSGPGLGIGNSPSPYSGGHSTFATPTPPATPYDNRFPFASNNHPSHAQRGGMQAHGPQAVAPFALQQSHWGQSHTQQSFSFRGLPGSAAGFAPATQQTLLDQHLPYMEQRYHTRLDYQNSFDAPVPNGQNQTLSTLQANVGHCDNSRLNTPQRSDIPSAASDRSFEGVFPTALTPMSWSGLSENKTAPPSPGPFTPFSPMMNADEGFDGTQMKEENDVLGILAGLTCDDEGEDEEKMMWAGTEVVKDYGPIGQERRNSAVDAA